MRVARPGSALPQPLTPAPPARRRRHLRDGPRSGPDV